MPFSGCRPNCNVSNPALNILDVEVAATVYR